MNILNTNKFNDKNLIAIDSNIITKKISFFPVYSDSHNNFLSNNYSKNDFKNNINNNYLENISNRVTKLESDRQLINANNETKNNGLNLNGIINPKIINSKTNDKLKNKESKGNLIGNPNGFNSFNHHKTIRIGSINNNNSMLFNKKKELSLVKLPNIK